MKNVVTFCRAMLYISAAQGSVLGLLLFVLYAADVMKIALQHSVNIHEYADDMQTYTPAAKRQINSPRSTSCSSVLMT